MSLSGTSLGLLAELSRSRSSRSASPSKLICRLAESGKFMGLRYYDHTMKHPKEERTLIILKPDAIQRALIGEIIARYERLGLKLVGLKMVVATEKQIEGHYTLDPNWRRVTGEKTIKSYKDRGLKPPSEDPLAITAVILKNLKKYMTAGPVIAMVWEGAHAVELVRKITGGTEPRGAHVGTIRGDFVVDSYVMSDADDRAVRNLIHASGTISEAEIEIPHWFGAQELIDYKVSREDILYEKELRGILP